VPRAPRRHWEAIDAAHTTKMTVEARDAPVVHLRLDSSPETLTLVRGVLGALAEVLVLDAELLDDLKTAISEACNNVVLHAYGDDIGPLEVELFVSAAMISAVVLDEGSGMPDAADPEEGVHGVGVPLIKALADRVDFSSRPGGGTEVRLEFSASRTSTQSFYRPQSIAPEDGWSRQLTGDTVVSLSPLLLLGPVLGRLARALAARARFSLDRFSDVYLVTDALAAHAARAAGSERVGFSISTSTRRLEIALGPMREGSGSLLTSDRGVREPGSALSLLSDSVNSRAITGGEVVQVVLTDESGPPAATR
jgi:anti-sigma regulatory factor (Ser/Thr protein kinase)